MIRSRHTDWIFNIVRLDKYEGKYNGHNLSLCAAGAGQHITSFWESFSSFMINVFVRT